MNDAKCGSAMCHSRTTISKNNPMCFFGHFRHTKVNRDDSKAQQRGFGDVNKGRALLIGRRELPVRHALPACPTSVVAVRMCVLCHVKFGGALSDKVARASGRCSWRVVQERAKQSSAAF